MATLTPSRASSLATALPIPRLPPVMIATLPLSPRSTVVSPLKSSGGRTADIDGIFCLTVLQRIVKFDHRRLADRKGIGHGRHEFGIGQVVRPQREDATGME